MSTVNEIIKNRHTTRLMSGNVADTDLEIILDSARRAPSKNKIYGYTIFSLENSEEAIELKNELCNDITTCTSENNETVYLLQTKAPLVLLYVANPAPEHQMVGINKEVTGEEVYDRDYSEVTSQVTRYVMIKSSIRDSMISATYAQLTAESLGYGTAFVACGIENIVFNKKFNTLFENYFGENYKNKPIEPVVLLCIGPKDQKIIDLYNQTSTLKQESYLNGITHYARSGREESFKLNKKQQSMIVKI